MQSSPHSTPAPARSWREELAVQRRLIVPVVVGNLASMGMGVVDTVMVGDFGGDALGGVALAVLWAFGVATIPRAAAKGIDPIVSQAFGAGERHAAGAALVQGLVLAAAMSLPVALLHLVAAPGLALLGQPAGLLPLAGDYAAVMALGVPAMLGFVVLRQFLLGLGVARPSTVAVLVGNALNVGLNLLLMHGLGPWPGLGPIGCAWSSVVGQVAMLALLVWLTRRELAAWWPADALAAARDLAGIGRQAALGLPIGVQAAVEVWGFQAAGLMVGWLGETAVAAHTVAMNLATLSFMTPLGIGAAASTRIGNLLGAGRPWGRAAAVAMVSGAVVMGLSAALFSLLPGPLARVYTDDAAVVALAVTVLPVAGAFQLFDGVQVVGLGVLRGLSDVRVPVLVNVVAFWTVGLPLGWWLAFRAGFGVPGMWGGLMAALVCVSVAVSLRILWQHRRAVGPKSSGQ